MRQRIGIVAGRLLLLALWGLVWEATAHSGALPEGLIGRPSRFLAAFAAGVADGTFPAAALITLQAVLIAFALGALLALLTALLMAVSPTLERLAAPIIDALNALPRVALIPLFILWFGIGLEQKVASGLSIMYFVLLSYTLAGAKATDPDHLLLARSLGVPGWKAFLQIVIPSALPSIFAGLRLGMIYTVLGVITAELIAGGKGLGTLVSYYSNTFNPNGLFATLIALVAVTTALIAAMSRIERTICKWRQPVAL